MKANPYEAIDKIHEITDPDRLYLFVSSLLEMEGRDDLVGLDYGEAAAAAGDEDLSIVLEEAAALVAGLKGAPSGHRVDPDGAGSE